nr:agamous-like MADS-box protein AGL80 [Tanacetum cinerariifolium]
MAWPSKEQAETMMTSFMSLPEEQRKKKGVSHEMFPESLLAKKYKKLEALRTKNNHMEMEEVLRKFLIDPTSIEPATGKLTRLFLYLNDMIAQIEENESTSQSETNVVNLV